jgi:hypothetical protein
MDPRREDDERERTADDGPSIVDRVRANIGEREPDDERGFDRGSLSAWLGEEPPREPIGAAPTLPVREPPASTPRPRRKPILHDRRFLLVAALAFLLAVAAAGTSTLAVVNARRADDWQARVQQVELQTKVINDLLVERSHDVNARTRALNATAARLRATRRALTRSEADVRALVRRQTELANEKAQAEDASR